MAEDASSFIIGWKAVTFLDATATLEIQEWLHTCGPLRVSVVNYQHLKSLNKRLQKESDTDQQNVHLDTAESTHLDSAESTHLMPITRP